MNTMFILYIISVIVSLLTFVALEIKANYLLCEIYLAPEWKKFLVYELVYLAFCFMPIYNVALWLNTIVHFNGFALNLMKEKEAHLISFVIDKQY